MKRVATPPTKAGRWPMASAALLLAGGCEASTSPASSPRSPSPAVASAAPAEASPIPPGKPQWLTAADLDTSGLPRVAGRDFSVALPVGFVSITDPAAPPELRGGSSDSNPLGGVFLVARDAPSRGERGRIVVFPANGVVPLDAAGCNEYGQERAEDIEGKLMRASWVETGNCVWIALNEDAGQERVAYGAQMDSSSGRWEIICEGAPDDRSTKVGCAQIVASWKRDP